MQTPQNATALVADIVQRASHRGADAADAIYVAEAASDIKVRLGKLEDVGRSEGEEVGLRVFIGQSSASISSSDLSVAGLEAGIERAVAMARNAPEDPYAALVDKDQLMTGDAADYDLFDKSEIAPEALRDRALAIEDAARAVNGVSNSQGAGVSAGEAVVALATSNGFAHGYRSSHFGASAAVLAGEGDAMQRDYAYRTARHWEDLEDAASLGQRAGARAVARLNPQPLGSGAMPVVFDPRVSSSLIGHLLGAISGSTIARKSSFLLDSLNERLFAPQITIVDDPHRMRGLRSRAFDGEGVKTQKHDLIKDGRLTGWLLNRASASQLKLPLTGHASRAVGGAPGISATNVHMQPGTDSPAALMADIKQGVYVTELIGQGVNIVTGDYSRGAGGFIIRNGQLAEPVAEITIAGNLKAMFAALIAADDLHWHHGVNCPTVRVDGMTVAGN